MRFVSFEQAWPLYLQAVNAGFLPSLPTTATHQSKTRRVADVHEAVALCQAQAVVLDAYGVLHTGSGAFPHALAAVKRLQDAGMSLLVVTNDVTHAPEDVARRLQSMGFDLPTEAVISGRSVLPEVLRAQIAAQGSTGTAAPWLVLGSAPEAIAAQTPGAIAADWQLEALNAAAGFVFVDSNGWEEGGPEQDLLYRTLRHKPRPIILCNPDITCPYQGRLSLEPGYPAFGAAIDIPGVSIIGLGKPYDGVYERVIHRVSAMVGCAPERVDRSRILCVGDSPHTDVLGAQRAGMSALLVETGLTQGRDPFALFAECGLQPEFVAATL